MEPVALASAYFALEPSLTKLAGYAATRLRAEVTPIKPVTVETRVKSLSSVHEKLMMGEYASLTELDDLAGVKVVLLRKRDVFPVAAVIRTAFQLIRDKERVVDPSTFGYRERHLIVKPPADYIERNPDLNGLAVEIQLTTALQFALDQATHNFDYKGSTLDWARFRLVAQLRATLELVDTLLDSADASAALIAEDVQFPSDLIDQNATLEAMEAHFADDAMPSDRRRFAQTAHGWLRAAGLSPDTLDALLARHDDLVKAQSITPLDALLGAILRERRSQLLGGFSGRFLVSNELQTLCSEAVALPQDRLVAL